METLQLTYDSVMQNIAILLTPVGVPFACVMITQWVKENFLKTPEAKDKWSPVIAIVLGAVLLTIGDAMNQTATWGSPVLGALLGFMSTKGYNAVRGKSA